MTSCTPGISSSPISTRPWLPVMPIAVRCAPGMLCGRSPCASIFLHTARTCSSVACACITTNIACLRKHQFSRARGRSAETECPALSGHSPSARIETLLYAPQHCPRTRHPEAARAEIPAPAYLAAHWHSHLYLGRRRDCGRARLPAGMQYLPDIFFQSAAVEALPAGPLAMRPDARPAGEIWHQAAGHPYQLSD